MAQALYQDVCLGHKPYSSKSRATFLCKKSDMGSKLNYTLCKKIGKDVRTGREYGPKDLHPNAFTLLNVSLTKCVKSVTPMPKGGLYRCPQKIQE